MVVYFLILAGFVAALFIVLIWLRYSAATSANPSSNAKSSPPANSNGLNKSEMEDMLDWLENQGLNRDCEITVENDRFRINPRQSA